jgi:phenylacetate-CoA ligase
MEIVQAAQNDLDYLEQCQFAPEQVSTIQKRKLPLLWKRAMTTSYYASLAEEAPEKFQEVAITPKAVVKQQAELFQPLYTKQPLKYYETSGTTGRPTPTLRFAEDIICNVLSVAGLWKRVLQQQDRVASLLPSDVAPVGDLVADVCEYLEIGMVRCYPYAMGICDWDRLEHIFHTYQPTCIFAAPGVLIQWMRLLKQRGDFNAIRAKISKIMLLGEVCTPGLQHMLKRNWQAEVFNVSYGSTETGTIGATCEYGSLHALNYSFILELHISDQLYPLLPGTQGELIATPLNNFARPLLRYATGDIVTVSPHTVCQCELALPVLHIQGRKEDQLHIDGVSLDLETIEHLVYGLENITGYMVEMRSDGSNARLLLEKDIDFNSSQDDSVRTLREQFAARGIAWKDIVLLNQLPAITKSGAGQKNWKKTNVRVIA